VLAAAPPAHNHFNLEIFYQPFTKRWIDETVTNDRIAMFQLRSIYYRPTCLCATSPTTARLDVCLPKSRRSCGETHKISVISLSSKAFAYTSSVYPNLKMGTGIQWFSSVPPMNADIAA
jgi:hypothetical protein